MPWKVVKTPLGYGVYNLLKKHYNSKNTSLAKAKAQLRLLNMVENKKLKFKIK